jgi:spore coat protein U-like protein
VVHSTYEDLSKSTDMVKYTFYKDNSGRIVWEVGKSTRNTIIIVFQARDRYLGFELRKWQWG